MNSQGSSRGAVARCAFSHLDLVQLPRLDAQLAQALGNEMLLAAKGKKLPECVEEALSELGLALRTVKDCASKGQPPASANPARAKEADAALDSCWSGLFEILTGWSRMPGEPLATTASELLALLYPQGIDFLVLSHEVELAASAARLGTIEERGLDAELDELGATLVLRHLRAAHLAYAKVLAVTNPGDGPTDAPADSGMLRDALAQFRSALRRYVVCVAGSARRRDPKSSELVDELLAPLSHESVDTPPETQGPRTLRYPPLVAPPEPSSGSGGIADSLSTPESQKSPDSCGPSV